MWLNAYFSSPLSPQVYRAIALLLPPPVCITEYSCALQCDILVHGRLYLSKNYACFYANILTWEKSVRHIVVVI